MKRKKRGKRRGRSPKETKTSQRTAHVEQEQKRVKQLRLNEEGASVESVAPPEMKRRQSRFNRLFARAISKQSDEQSATQSAQGSNTERGRAVEGVLVGMREYVKGNTERFYGLWDYLIIILSITSVGMIFIQQLGSVSTEFLKLFRLFDHLICLLFFCDFSFRLFAAKSKRAYLKWGWIDLVSSIPILDQLRWGRMFRLLRIVRAIKGTMRGHQRLERKIQDPFISVVLIAFLCVFLGAISVLHLESGVDGSNIKNARDAIWWALVTVTTVGYGDFTPITNEGRLVAVVLMSAGIGIFGIFSVQCTQYLMSNKREDERRALNELRAEISALRDELKVLSAHLSESDRRAENSEIDQK